MSFSERINSHHADLAIAYKPWVYTSSKWIWEERLIPEGAYTRRGLYQRELITGIEKVLRNKLWQS